MKKHLLFTLLFSLFFSVSYAQFDLGKLFGGANAAFAKPTGDFSEFAKGGLCINAVVGYSITDNIGVGVEYSTALTASISDSLSGIFGLEIFALDSYLAKGWYKFTKGTVKPYAAIGLGVVTFAEPDITPSGGATVKGARRTGLGGNIELGLAMKGFNLSYAFNVNGKAPSDPVFSPGIKDLSVNYHRFALGYIYNF